MMPEKLKELLAKLGISEDIYEQRSRKCILSREPLKLERVPWYEHAYYVPEAFDRKDLFIFDPVSLVPCLALEPRPSDAILDMCAAPGTKTFILSFLTENEAKITANDISYNRLKRLRFNVEKFGLSVEISNMSGRKIEGSYDKILLDAPCSGEGMVNKKDKVFINWSEKRAKLFSKKQKKLIARAFELLKPDGILVYSTCTFSPEENEDVINFLLRKYPKAALKEINVGIRHENGITEGTRKCMRIYPHHNGTGGFFVAKIRHN